MKRSSEFSELANLLVEELRKPPPPGGLRNALQHMWGHVSRRCTESLPLSRTRREVESWSLARVMAEIRRRVILHTDPYLSASTALGELQAWLPRT